MFSCQPLAKGLPYETIFGNQLLLIITDILFLFKMFNGYSRHFSNKFYIFSYKLGSFPSLAKGKPCEEALSIMNNNQAQ